MTYGRKAATYAVCTPSRGLIHSRTVTSVMANVMGAPGFLGWFITHDLPIPDCHQRVAEAGLESGADALWFVEEDVVPPASALMRLFDRLVDDHVAVIDYPQDNAQRSGGWDWSCVARGLDGTIEYAGLGCTMIRREVLEKLERPWFRTDVGFRFPRRDGRKSEEHTAVPYGGQDIYFSQRVLAAGFHIGQVPEIAAHARVTEFGRKDTNYGCHTIHLADSIHHGQQV